MTALPAGASRTPQDRQSEVMIVSPRPPLALIEGELSRGLVGPPPSVTEMVSEPSES